MATSETVAVELVAQVQNFDGKIKQSAANFGSGMKQIEAAGARAEGAIVRSTGQIGRALDQTSQRSRLLGYQISDIGAQLAGGQSPFLILAQQAPQVANALEGARGSVGRFATFLSGPWGAAMLAAGSLLAIMASKYIDVGNAVDDAVAKLKESAQKTRDANAAQEVFADTLEGVEAALDANREAMQKLNLIQDTGAESALKAAEASRQRAIQIRETTIALLEQAKAEYAASRSQNFGAAGGAGAGMAQSIYAGRVSDLDAFLKRAEEGLRIAREQTVQARAAVIVEREMASREDQINRKYDQRIAKASALAIANGTVETSLQKQVKAINAAREAELKRYRDTQKAQRESERGTTKLAPVTGREVAEALGTTITSGQRSAAKNRAVGGGKNSYHLTGQAIDIPLTVNGKPLTKAGIRSALEPLGIQIKELLGPGDKNHNDHFHIAFDKKRATPDKIAQNQQNAVEAAERERLEGERRLQAYQNELANMMAGEVDARQALVTSAEEIAKLELEGIELARKKYADNLASLQETGKLTAEEAVILSGINDERAKLRAELVQRREAEREFRMAEAERQRQAEVASARRGDEADVLQGQLDLARTQKERRNIELRLLDLQFQEEKIRNDMVIAFAERLKTEVAHGRASQEALDEAVKEADIARLRNESIDKRKGQAAEGATRGTATGFEAYFSEMPGTADQINEALENVAAGGLATFTDALTDAIVNFTSLGDVGLAVLQNLTAGLVKMAVQQLLLNTLAKAFGDKQKDAGEQAKGAIVSTSAAIAQQVAQQAAMQAIQTSFAATAAATSAALGAAVAAAWAPAAAATTLATFGANAAPAAAALAATNALATALAVPRADGGPIFGKGGPRDDKVLMAASPGEYVIKASSAAKLGRGTLDFLNTRGEMPTFRAAGGPIGFTPINRALGQRAGGGMDEASLKRIEAAVERGARAQAPVQLYPTLDASAALQAALSQPGGQKAMFDFVTANSGRFGSALRR